MVVAQSCSYAELSDARQALKAHLEPCGSQAVIAELVPMVTLYGVQDRSEQEWATFWGFYTRILGELPLEAVRKGVADYVARPDSLFFPKPGQLHAICEQYAIPIRMAYSRARKATDLWQELQPPADPVEFNLADVMPKMTEGPSA